MSMSLAISRFISTHVCQVAVVTGSGVACSQGRYAPGPSPSEVEANGMRLNWNRSSVSKTGSSGAGSAGSSASAGIARALTSHQPPR